MQLTFKLYAGLMTYLPEDSKDHATAIEIDTSATVLDVVDRFAIPRDLVHLVLLNGVYLHPEERLVPCFNEGDTLAIWPPVAGG